MTPKRRVRGVHAEGRVAVVTGAGSGIGRGLALGLAARGAAVALCDVRAEALDEVAGLVRARGARAMSAAVDVADRDAVITFADRVSAELGAPQLLFNNAGVALNDVFERSDLGDLEWLMGVNFWGVVHGCHAFLPAMRTHERGWICNVSSVFGIIGVPEQSAYCAAKFAVRGFTEALDQELRGTGIGVSCVHPGAVASGIAVHGRFRRSASGVTRDGAHDLLSRGLSCERAAEIILSGVEGGRRRIVVGRDARVIDALARLAPVGYRSAVGAFVSLRRLTGRGSEAR